MSLDETGMSNFECRIVDGVLVIIDLDIGGMSVTNNIEAILRQIGDEHNLDIQRLDIPIVYRDSDGHFDGVRASKRGVRFYPLSKDKRIASQHEAVQAANSRHKKRAALV